ncbi:hypothetical protein A3A36_00635 [Candidatus Kaiserbacteria bacterium RIFCSPLOWO2_01_FULL_52_12b]|uniref:Uncharacterized protein n=1 Tax=Candidatus Kaiserbacteria bacterium RIFCSPLOWO2_01_FULL_52_12b TaxID=1798509 RepID=A0A1F6EX14_9BACT|nr:MAG: hypothetical protein A3A36_00635 [Candidatus Kaiserbacteria bacterium RIFCSPLOWO2_01_FULL_52_12b]
MPTNGNLLKPKNVADAIERYFKRTSAKEVVRRAEELTPPPESEPLGMLPDDAKDPLNLRALGAYTFPRVGK